MSTTTLQSTSIQLSTNGAQDHALYDAPDASLFSDATRRITPYAVSNQSVVFTEPFDFGRTITATLATNADMLTQLIFYVRLPRLAVAPGSTYTNWTQSVGYAAIEWIELLFGNVRVDMRTGEAMEMDNYQSTSADKALAVNKMVGRMTQISTLGSTTSSDVEEVYVPIPFHFTRGLDSALPVFMLDKQRVSVRLKIRPFDELVTYDGPVPPTPIRPVEAFMLADYALLTAEEKRTWLSRPYEHSFEQWQTVTTDLQANCSFAKVPLSFVNCVKEITWVLREVASADNNDWFNYALRAGQPGEELMSNARVTFDGRDRFPKMPESYYRLVNPQMFRTTAGDRNIYMVSFASKPELRQNTGTANLSRFDDVQLHMDLVANNPPCTLIVIAKSYNTLMIANGVASLKFSV